MQIVILQSYSTYMADPVTSFTQGYDCSVHLSEETEDASWTIPQVMLAAVASNAVMLLAVGITYIFCIGDLTSVLSTSTGQPVIQVLFNTTQNNAGTTIITLVIVIILLSACVGQVTTASRQLWSFARDGGETHYAGFSCSSRGRAGHRMSARDC